MDTNKLIQALVAQKPQLSADFSHMWLRAIVLATALAAAVVFATLSPRPDLADASGAPTFLLKLAFAISLGASAFGLILSLSRPGEKWREAAAHLAVAPAVLAVGVVANHLTPNDRWSSETVEPNGLVCMAAIFLVGLAPLAVILAALRNGAPTSPSTAGAIAGLLAGGIAITFFLAHCTSDSLLFAATWYTPAIAALATLGATAAHQVIRW